MTSKKPTLKLQTHRPVFVPQPIVEDDNRIDWERKNRKDKTELENEDIVTDDVLEVEDETVELLERKPTKGDKKKRNKARHLVVDEDSGRVLVKRRRKENRAYDDWHDDYE